LEDGPRGFCSSPPGSDPRYIIKLAQDGGFDGIVMQIALAEKFYCYYAG
jgi:fructose-bisphosphate aldolase, class I